MTQGPNGGGADVALSLGHVFLEGVVLPYVA